jgi:hypothetical protein
VSSLLQLCHVTGSIRFNGDELTVDSYDLRAKGWSTRSDLRTPPLPDGSQIAGASDTFGASANGSFFVGTFGGDLSGTDVYGGHLWRDGELRAVVGGKRTIVRRSASGYPEELLVEGVDDKGRTFRAEGIAVNRAFMQGTAYVLWSSGVSWIVDGEAMWGKDDDVPVGRTTRRFLKP